MGRFGHDLGGGCTGEWLWGPVGRLGEPFYVSDFVVRCHSGLTQEVAGYLLYVFRMLKFCLHGLRGLAGLDG